MTKVNAGVQHVFHGDLGHLNVLLVNPPSRRGTLIFRAPEDDRSEYFFKLQNRITQDFAPRQEKALRGSAHGDARELALHRT